MRQQGVSPVFGHQADHGLRLGAVTVRASNGFPRCAASAAQPLRPGAEIVCASNGFPRCLGPRRTPGASPWSYIRTRQLWISPMFGAASGPGASALALQPYAPAMGFPGVRGSGALQGA